ASLFPSLLISLLRRPPGPTLCPYTTLFRSMNRSTRNANLLAFPVPVIVLGISILVVRALPLIPVWITVLPAAAAYAAVLFMVLRSEEHTSELQSRFDLVCRLLLEEKKHSNT